jgi:CheY-like chemotaxis protein
MPRILLIEDNHTVRSAMHRMLVSAGYEVYETANGTDGLEAYRQQSADLIITDILMREGEGLGMIMDARGHNPGVKILAVSGAGQSYLDLARQFGADLTLSKPFSTEGLLTAVAEVLNEQIARA